jgi:PleD family two-component response regulator
MLHNVRTKYGITFDEHCRMETAIKIEAYVDALRIVWRDGVVTGNEEEVLQIMRRKYGLTPEDLAAAEKKFESMQLSRQSIATVLIVDADQEDLISAARALINQGLNVKIARRPEDAYRFLRSTIPDLILSELVFPETDTDGFEFYKTVRAETRLSQVPFVMMTYPGDARVVRAGLRMGVDYFIPKPLHLDFMVAIVEGKLRSTK